MKIKLEDLITQKEAAEIRGVTSQSINDLVKRGKLSTVTIGKRKFLLRSEVKKYKPEVGGRPRKKPAAKTKRPIKARKK
jgi:excisionase family DNA binding protein